MSGTGCLTYGYSDYEIHETSYPRRRVVGVAGRADPGCRAGQRIHYAGILYNSDPTCHQIGDTFYLYCSHDQSTRIFTKGSYPTMFDYHCYSTTNFKDWVDHGSIINSFDGVWDGTPGPLWDGDAGIAANGKILRLFPFRQRPV